jgi:hypothetical protein
MELTCPKCSKQLPEVETVEYRFCPHCGAEIAAAPRKLEEAVLTIPPALATRQFEQTPDGLSLDTLTGQKVSPAGQFNDQTIEPQPMTRQSQRKIKPPTTSPPSGFFRINSAETTHSISSGKKEPPKKVIKKRSPTKTRNIIIATLVILTVIVLVLGGVFTF